MKPINRRLQAEKMVLARRASTFLVTEVPWVRAVGLTGSVAWGDVSEDDDLDFCIITAKNRVWTTRLWCYIWATLLRKKRGKNRERDRWCLNMFLDETALVVPVAKRDEFGRAQLERLVVLQDEKQLLAAARAQNAPWMQGQPQAEVAIEPVVARNLGDIAEIFCRWAQMAYMRRKMTRELVNERQIFFHPLKRV